jgi:SprB repeat
VAFAAQAQPLRITNFKVSVPRYYFAVKRVVTKLNNHTSFNPFSTLSYYNDNANQTIITKRNFISSSLSSGQSIEFYDTINVIDFSNQISLISGDVFAPFASNTTNNSGTITSSATVNIPTGYVDSLSYDSVASKVVSSSHYRITTIVKGIPNTDISLTLPSDDPIRLIATARNDMQVPGGTVGGYTIEYKWYYKFNDSIDAPNSSPPSPWIPIASSDTSALFVSGKILWPNNYLDTQYLNKTVFIIAEAHVKAPGMPPSIATKIQPFSYRLSAPHITNFIPTNVLCAGGTTGGFRVEFDRALRPGERINLLLSDAHNYVDYSRLNINSLDGANGYNWTNGLLASPKYQLSMIGKYQPIVSSNEVTYTSAPTHFKLFEITQPDPFDFTVTKNHDVLCKGGNSGSLLMSAIGGTMGYKYSTRFITDASGTPWAGFANAADPSLSKQGFKVGTYYVQVRDANNCIVKDSLGVEKNIPVDFTEPSSAVRLDMLQTSPITHSDSANGSILVKVAGGTQILETTSPYTFSWKDSATNQPISPFSLDTTNGQFKTGIDRLAGGTYIFTAQDANYNVVPGISYSGCLVQAVVPLPKPFPLQALLALKKPNSCNQSNNGVIRVVATGGVRFTTGGLLYNFTWYKQETNGSWTVLSNTDSVLIKAEPGNYKVSIKDKFNTVNISPVFTMTEPTAINLSFTKTAASCFSTADGTATVTATGGTYPAYKYQWSNGDTLRTADSLAGGTYILQVLDTMGCEKLDSVRIVSPNEVKTTISTIPVACFGQSNGTISTAATGGTLPYTYTWNTSANTATATGLAAGKYWVKVRDNNNCFTTDTVILSEPPAYTVNAGPDRNICTQQRLWLDATVAGRTDLQYYWTGPAGFTANGPRAYASLPGTYYVTVSNPSLCLKKDTVVLTPVNAIVKTDFVVSTQSFVNSNLLLANLSQPAPDSVKWILPQTNAVQLINQSRNYCELKFTDTGAYYITMRAYYPGGCIDDTTKKVIITTSNGFPNLGNQANAFLKKFEVYPNPNPGNFFADLVFNDVTKARLRLVNTLTNLVVSDRSVEGSYTYKVEYSMGPVLPKATYILVIETAKGSFIHKVVVQ